MIRAEELNKEQYRIGEVANLMNVTTETIRNYERRGLLNTSRSAGGQRIIKKEDLKSMLRELGMLVETLDDSKNDIVFISDSIQKQNDAIVEMIQSIEKSRNIKIVKESNIKELMQVIVNNNLGSLYVYNESEDKELKKLGVKQMLKQYDINNKLIILF